MVLAIFFLIFWAVAYEDTGFGILRAIDKEIGTSEEISTFGQRLVTSKHSSVFNHYKDGAVSKFASGKYVSLDEVGLFIMREAPDSSWELSQDEMLGNKRIFKYNIANVFTACNDGSLGLHIRCEGARSVYFQYTDFGEYELQTPGD